MWISTCWPTGPPRETLGYTRRNPLLPDFGALLACIHGARTLLPPNVCPTDRHGRSHARHALVHPPPRRSARRGGRVVDHAHVAPRPHADRVRSPVAHHYAARQGGGAVRHHPPHPRVRRAVRRRRRRGLVDHAADGR